MVIVATRCTLPFHAFSFTRVLLFHNPSELFFGANLLSSEGADM